jgi:acetyl-CoA carboxylase biotin carboxylase subunit
MDIPIFYDPMIAKLVAYSATREEAIERLCRAIDEYHIKGIQTTLPFGKWAVRHEAFKSGNFDTKFIDKYFKPAYLQQWNDDSEEVAALLAATIWDKEKSKKQAAVSANGHASSWKLRRK